jgi:hypothetical protein
MKRLLAGAVLAVAALLPVGCGWHPGGIPHVSGTHSGSARAN